MKLRKYLWVLPLALIFICQQPQQGAVVAEASSLTSASIQEKEQQISDAKKEIDSLKAGITDIKKIKQELENKKNDLKAYIVQLDDTIQQVEENINDLKSRIAVKENEILITEGQLAEAIAQENDQRTAVMINIRLMYEKKDSYIVELLSTAGGINQLLNKASYMERVAGYDKKLWEDYTQHRIMVELMKEQLETERMLLDESRIALEAEQANLEELVAQKQADLLAYETDIKSKQAAIREYEEDIAAQDEIIKQLEQAILEEKKQMLQSSIIYDGGQFKFPLASYTRISSEYGWRIHPTLGVNKFHNGVDFAAPKGTAIYAAYDGKVVAATYNSTMGNYVMIDHGSGLFTIYMHASKLYVQSGDVVVKGETIAGVGTTGRSTGNHLHFGVRLNGEYVSPWNYLSK